MDAELGGGHSFQELLLQLRDAHAQELAAVRAQVSNGFGEVPPEQAADLLQTGMEPQITQTPQQDGVSPSVRALTPSETGSFILPDALASLCEPLPSPPEVRTSAVSLPDLAGPGGALQNAAAPNQLPVQSSPENAATSIAGLEASIGSLEASIGSKVSRTMPMSIVNFDSMANVGRVRTRDPSLELRTAWMKEPKRTGGVAVPNFLPTVEDYILHDDAATRSKTSSKISIKGSLCSRLISTPSSTWRLYWDVTGAALIGYDTVTIPFVFAFNLQDVVFLTAMDWITMFFWTSDMFATFFVGYHHKGALVMSPGRIARRYLLTWFILDIIVNVGDWFGNVGSLLQVDNQDAGGGAGGGAGESAAQEAAQVLRRVIRAVRVVRLVRLLKLSRLVTVVQDHINSEITFVLFGISKLLFFILAINHFIACTWFLLGRTLHESGEPSWVFEENIIDRSTGYKYTTALHWTLTQFTPASMEVFPENTPERTMAVIVLVFALVAFSSFVGSITGSMTQLRNMNADRDKQFWLLRRFLKQSEVPKSVNLRILRYLQYVCQSKSSMVERSDVKVIGLLSDQLRDELDYHIIIPNCAGHLLFGHCSQHMEVPMRQVCATGMKQRNLAGGDHLFYTSDQASHSYFFISGELLYSRPGTNLESTVEPRECISEATLWLNWQHRGSMRSARETEVIALDAEKFINVMGKHEDTWQFCATYGRKFLNVFELSCDGTQRDPNDLIRVQNFHMDVLIQAVDNFEEMYQERTGPSRLELAALALTLQAGARAHGFAGRGRKRSSPF